MFLFLVGRKKNKIIIHNEISVFTCKFVGSTSFLLRCDNPEAAVVPKMTYYKTRGGWEDGL